MSTFDPAAYPDFVDRYGNPEEGPGARSGAELLDEAESLFRRYTVHATEHAYVALALYAAYTHAAACFDFAPRLLLTSAEKRSGKTRTMEILGHLSSRPLFAANATVPALFRSLSSPRTVLFDEADTIFGAKVKAEQNEDLRGLINAGFQRGTPVLRTVGPTHEPTQFNVFAPVVLAAIGRLPDTIQDRAVNIRCRRRKPEEHVTPFRLSRNVVELERLAAAFAAWVGDHGEKIRATDPVIPLEDRAADLWEPLLAVAEVAGGSWPDRGRQAAVHLAALAAEDDEDHSEGHELLSDVRRVTQLLHGEHVGTATLLELLANLEDSRWADPRITGRRLAELLKPYGIRPRPNTERTARGYRTEDLQDAFDRYLNPPRSEESCH